MHKVQSQESGKKGEDIIKQPTSNCSSSDTGNIAIIIYPFFPSKCNILNICTYSNCI